MRTSEQKVWVFQAFSFYKKKQFWNERVEDEDKTLLWSMCCCIFVRWDVGAVWSRIRPLHVQWIVISQPMCKPTFYPLRSPLEIHQPRNDVKLVWSGRKTQINRQQQYTKIIEEKVSLNDLKVSGGQSIILSSGANKCKMKSLFPHMQGWGSRFKKLRALL